MPDRNKIAIVTGGSRGLGANTVLALARQGVRSIFSHHSSRGGADRMVEAVRQAGADAAALPLDTRAAEGFGAFVDGVRSALAGWGVERFDHHVNNAGMSDDTPFADVTAELLDRVYSVNFKGVFLLTQRLVPLMEDGERIVNVSTGPTRFWTPNTIPYASLKGTIEVFTTTWPRSWGHATSPSTPSRPARSRPTSAAARCATIPRWTGRSRARPRSAGPRSPTTSGR